MGKIENLRHQLAKIRKGLKGPTTAEKMREEPLLSGAQEDDGQLQEPRNQAVHELAQELGIGKYLEVLKNKIAPGREVGEWGPHNGGMGYSLVFNEKEEKIITNHFPNPGGLAGVVQDGRDGTFAGYKTGPRVVKSVLGVVITHNNQLLVASNQCAVGYNRDEDINPLTWGWKRMKSNYWNSGKTYYGAHIAAQVSEEARPTRELLFKDPSRFLGEGSRVFGNLKNVHEGGGQQLAQALSDFYSGFKAGQVK